MAICVILVTVFILSASINGYDLTYSSKLTAEINSRSRTWQASLKFAPDASKEYIKSLTGTFLGNDKANNYEFQKDIGGSFSQEEIPASFDARKYWPRCNYTISQIRDQGACGSCWATAAASTFSDRVCIAHAGTWNSSIAIEDVLACTFMGGCYGGWLLFAWFHIKHTGAVTGGDYGSDIGCKPYSIQPCNHHGTSSRPKCSALVGQTSTPKCKSYCSNDKYKTTLKQDLIKAKHYYSVSGEVNMQKAILSGGPVETGFDVYEDFIFYSSGVYQHILGKYLGGHAVKVFGWGEEGGVKYWSVANSWNTDWGEKGFFKIRRGNNECDFERVAYFGTL